MPTCFHMYCYYSNAMLKCKELLFFTILGIDLSHDDHVSKTTAVINLKGSIDLMISPLLLESVQRLDIKIVI